jgi:hypothetical protein
MTQAALFPTSPFSLEDWSGFYEELMQAKPKALDKVIGILENCIQCERGIKVPNFFDDEAYKDDKGNCLFIRNRGIFYHFYNFITRKTYEAKLERNSEQGKKYGWNLACNLLRTLKRTRDNEAPYLLPQQDRDNLAEFIERIATTPINPFFN